MIHIEEIKHKVIPILKKHGIAKAGIFGSGARRELVINDIDLLVEIDHKVSLLEFIEIKQELEEELAMKVDLVEYNALKPALREEILKEEVPIL